MQQNDMKNIGKFDLLKIMLTAKDHDLIPLLVTGGSMQPFLLDRETVVYLEKDSDYRPQKGDIILYWRGDDVWVLHRAIRVYENGEIRTNGDGQKWTEVIRSEQVVARVVYFVRKGRTVSVDGRFYRFLVRIWMPLRWLHPPVAWCTHVIRRLPYKLFPKYMEKRNSQDGLDG